jgi:hypothetical protein
MFCVFVLFCAAGNEWNSCLLFICLLCCFHSFSLFSKGQRHARTAVLSRAASGRHSALRHRFGTLLVFNWMCFVAFI